MRSFYTCNIKRPSSEVSAAVLIDTKLEMATGSATGDTEGTDSVLATIYREERIEGRRTEETFSFLGIMRDDGAPAEGVTNEMLLKLLETLPDIPKSCVSALYLCFYNCKYPF